MAPKPAGSSAKLLLTGTGAESVPEGLEAQLFQQPNKQMPTYTLLQQVWNKVKQLQQVTGYTAYSPLWRNKTYEELAKLQRGARWCPMGITHLRHDFHNERLLSFTDLQSKFERPSSMLFYYLQIKHAVKAQGTAVEWVQSPTPVFHILLNATDTKGIISQCYLMLLSALLEGFPMKAATQWEADLGPITGEQWAEAPQAVNTCSLNVSQKVSQLYILLRAHYTSVKLHKMGKLPDSMCGKCRIVPDDLIHLLWCCPKFHRYWESLLIHYVAFWKYWRGQPQRK